MIKNEKGEYYTKILSIMGSNKFLQAGVKRFYKEQIKGIFESLPHYFRDEHIVDKEEFIFSMRWVLADLFGNGCEVEEPEDLFIDVA